MEEPKYRIELTLKEIIIINDALRMIMYGDKPIKEAEEVFLKLQTLLDGGV